MDNAQRTIDSLKLLQDWSKWLISLETVVCIGLWSKLKTGSGFMYAGWLMFWASIIVAAILLLSIAIAVRHADESGDRRTKRVWLLVRVQYGFFLAGLFCLAAHVVLTWLGILS